MQCIDISVQSIDAYIFALKAIYGFICINIQSVEVGEKRKREKIQKETRVEGIRKEKKSKGINRREGERGEWLKEVGGREKKNKGGKEDVEREREKIN